MKTTIFYDQPSNNKRIKSKEKYPEDARKMIREFSHFRSKCICCCCTQTSNCLSLNRTEETYMQQKVNLNDGNLVIGNSSGGGGDIRMISSEYTCERSIQCRKVRFIVRNYWFKLLNTTKSTPVSFFSLRRRGLR